jgi:ferredoxin-type protein NapF
VVSRRDFLTAFKKPLEKGVPKTETLIVRPPYGSDTLAFEERCTACDSKACAPVCEERIIVIRADGTPMLNFTKRGCTFCEACAIACDGGVLDLENSHMAEKVNARFIITPDSCVAHNGVVCFSCKEPCIDDAILFNGLFNPVIDMDRCTGCGFCFSRCPTKAISYEATEILNEEQI